MVKPTDAARNLVHFVTSFRLDDTKPIVQMLDDAFRVSYNVDGIFLHVTFKDDDIYTECSEYFN